MNATSPRCSTGEVPSAKLTSRSIYRELQIGNEKGPETGAEETVEIGMQTGFSRTLGEHGDANFIKHWTW